MNPSRPQYLLALAPLVVLAHIAEEAPGFLDWFNQHVEPDLGADTFVAINVTGVLITAFLAVPSVHSRSRALALGLVAWLGFVMLANGGLHLTASLVFREYVPGTVTAGVLYMPYFVAATITICRNLGIRFPVAMGAAAIGSVPMIVQGVGVLAFGRRILW